MSFTSTSDVNVAAVSFLPQQTAVVTSPVVLQLDENSFFDRSGEIIGNFIESGQVWALLIGIVLGYAIRGMTTY
ncbi:MAG: hypothetical protein AAF821_08545 [Cyanobacteria bacterium P01_D01_bin.156]